MITSISRVCNFYKAVIVTKKDVFCGRREIFFWGGDILKSKLWHLQLKSRRTRLTSNVLVMERKLMTHKLPPGEHRRLFALLLCCHLSCLLLSPKCPTGRNVDWRWWIIHTAGHSGAPFDASHIINILSTLMRFRQSCLAVTPAAQQSLRPWAVNPSD